MKAKRVNEANSYLTSPIFPRFISRKRVQQEQALQHADFLEGHARSLGTNLPRFMGALDLLKSEEIGSNRKKYESGLFSGYQRLLSDFFLPGHDIPETI